MWLVRASSSFMRTAFRPYWSGLLQDCLATAANLQRWRLWHQKTKHEHVCGTACVWRKRKEKSHFLNAGRSASSTFPRPFLSLQPAFYSTLPLRARLFSTNKSKFNTFQSHHDKWVILNKTKMECQVTEHLICKIVLYKYCIKVVYL